MDKKAKKRSLGLSKTEKRIVICTAAVVLIALSIYPTVTYLVPFIKYSHAVSLMEKGSFDEATAAFEEMGDYKDAPEKIGECAELKKQARLEAAYQDAVALMENKEYDKAISAFRAIEDYKDAKDKISECVKLREQVRLETDYQEGLNLKASGSYDKAISKLESVHGYKDSEDQIKEIKFMQAQGFFDQTSYETAADIFKGLGDYPNAEEMWKESVYQQALQLANAYNSEETYIVSSGYFSDSDLIYSLLESIKGYKKADDWLDKFFLLQTAKTDKTDKNKRVDFAYISWPTEFKPYFDGNYYYTYQNEDGTPSSRTTTNGMEHELFYENGEIVHERIKSSIYDTVEDHYYQYEHNSDGQVIKRTHTYPYWDDSTATSVTTYKYDKNGNVIEEKEANDKNSSTTRTYKYDDNNRIIESIYDSTTNNSSIYTTTTYDYSDPTRVCLTTSKKGTLTKETNYMYYSWVCLRKDLPKAGE